MSPSVFTADEQTFTDAVTRSPLPVLLDFATPWCPPCRALEPVLSRIAREHEGEVRVVRVDADASPALATRFRVKSFPTVIALVGGEERGRHVGATSAAVLLGLLGA